MSTKIKSQRDENGLNRNANSEKDWVFSAAIEALQDSTSDKLRVDFVCRPSSAIIR